jgi:hypothetical protein
MTVLAGILYYIVILHSEPTTWPTFFKWLVIVLVVYAIIFGLLRPVSGALNNGWILGLIVGVLVAAMAIAMLALNGGEGLTRTGTMQFDVIAGGSRKATGESVSCVAMMAYEPLGMGILRTLRESDVA